MNHGPEVRRRLYVEAVAKARALVAEATAPGASHDLQSRAERAARDLVGSASRMRALGEEVPEAPAESPVGAPQPRPVLHIATPEPTKPAPVTTDDVAAAILIDSGLIDDRADMVAAAPARKVEQPDPEADALAARILADAGLAG